jgi:hypothetical protein
MCNYADPFGLCKRGVGVWGAVKACWNSNYTAGDVLHASGHAGAAVLLAGTDPGGTAMHAYALGSLRASINEANALIGELGLEGAEANAFRHVFGACALARRVGASEAYEATDAHERTARKKDDAEQADSDTDMKNNAKGINFGSNPNNSGTSCQDFARTQARP